MLQWLPVSLVAAGAAWWLLSQAGALRELEAETAELRVRSERPTRAERAATGTEESALSREPRDWARIAKELEEGRLIAGVLPTNARLLADFEAMGMDELLAMLDEIEGAGLLTADRNILERHLAKLLIARDPEAGFSRFSDPKTYQWSFYLDALFSDWVEEDPGRSVQWLRNHIAGGGKVSNRMISQPFFRALGDDAEISTSLVTALPETRRLESLRCLDARNLHQASVQPAWARLVRNDLPEADRAEAIAWPLGNWSDGDGTPLLLHEAAEYMERIEANAEERRACVMCLAEQPRSWRGPDRKDVDFSTGLGFFRSWVAEVEPELVGEATVRALAGTARHGSLEEAGEFAIRMHEQTGDETYHHAVLDEAPQSDEAGVVRRLIDRVADESRRETYQKKLR